MAQVWRLCLFSGNWRINLFQTTEKRCASRPSLAQPLHDTRNTTELSSNADDYSGMLSVGT